MKEFLVFDIETNGLRPNKIFMIVIYNLITRTRDTYVGPDEVAVAIARLLDAQMLIGHGIKGFDLRIMNKLVGVKFDGIDIVDTVELSRFMCKLPNHKLATWGAMVGLPKLAQPLFEEFSPEMVPYCERDVDLNVLVFETLVDIMITDGWNHDTRPAIENYLSVQKQALAC